MALTKTRTKGKIARLCALLRQDILDGRFEPGAPLPSQKHLSKKYGVAQASVSTAIAQLANEGLAVRVPGQGSFVAQDLPPRMKMLDLVRLKSPPGKPEKASVITWIEALNTAGHEAGWTPRWHHLDYQEAMTPEDLSDQFSDSNGVIIFRAAPPELPSAFHCRGLPVVTVFDHIIGPHRYPRITWDRRAAARMAIEHLLNVGYRRIGFVALVSSPLPLYGFLDALSIHGMELRSEWIVSLERDTDLSRDLADGRLRQVLADFSQFLTNPNRPEAVCCPSESIAQVMQYVAAGLGLKVPEDLAIIACNGSLQSLPGQAAVTTVSVSRQECCKTAVDLIEQISGTPASRDGRMWEPIVLPLHLSVRESCGARLRDYSPAQTGTSHYVGSGAE